MNKVDCINKDDRKNPYERILYLGGTNPTGGRWKSSQQEVIRMIESGDYAFYVERPIGDRVDLVTATSPYGHKYVKTRPDGDEPNNLLSLPECR